MTRVKRGKIALKRRKNILKMVKGYRFGRSTKERQANEAIRHALKYAFRDRKCNKRNARGLWNVRINAGLRALGHTYSKFMGEVKKKNIEVNRKMLSEIAQENPETFKRIVEEVVS